MELSVVIPTLDEAADIGALLERLSRMRGVGEIVVTDGGSTDGTLELVVSSAARLVRARLGRGTAQARSDGGFRGRAPFLARRRRAAAGRRALAKGCRREGARRQQLPVAISEGGALGR